MKTTTALTTTQQAKVDQVLKSVELANKGTIWAGGEFVCGFNAQAYHEDDCFHVIVHESDFDYGECTAEVWEDEFQGTIKSLLDCVDTCDERINHTPETLEAVAILEKLQG